MITMKAGTYYIGDSCYVLREDSLEGFDWVEDICNYIEDQHFMVFNEHVVVFGTMYGDGCYESNVGYTFPVDAGIIGCTPCSLWKGIGEPSGCLKVEFKEDFTCYENSGTLVFGHIEVYTDD